MTTIDHLLSLESVRFRSNLLLENPQHLQNFDLDTSKLDDCAQMVVELVKRDYKTLQEIPPHSRWRHFEASTVIGEKIDRIGKLLDQWKQNGVDNHESVKRLLDLFVVGVLLDAGAGSQWTFVPKGESQKYSRSEGLGVASFDLFAAGTLSSVSTQPYQCDAKGLQEMTPEKLGKAFQVSEDNPLVGLEGRCDLLRRLGHVVEDKGEYFNSNNTFRPGNILDYLLKDASITNDGKKRVHINSLWTVVMKGLSGIWPPTRTVLENVYLGDVWPSKAMSEISKLSSQPLRSFPRSESFVCLHKLSQWLTYSLMEPLALADIVFEGVENMTGLAEYRNGGLFVDMKVLKLKDSILKTVPAGTIPRFQVWDDVVVEWRGLTVALLDQVANLVRKKLNMSKEELPLAKILEAGTLHFMLGTWKAGREIAAKLRPLTKGPPIEVISDGTVF